MPGGLRPEPRSNVKTVPRMPINSWRAARTTRGLSALPVQRCRPRARSWRYRGLCSRAVTRQEPVEPQPFSTVAHGSASHDWDRKMVALVSTASGTLVYGGYFQTSLDPLRDGSNAAGCWRDLRGLGRSLR